MKNDYSVINLRKIRKYNLPYIITWILYYTWVIVFTTWWTASSITDDLLGASSRTLLHSSYLIVSAITICIFKKEWFKKTGIIGSIITIVSAILVTVIKTPIFNTASIIALAISLGIVNVSILIPMVYIMNNTEKFYSVVGSFVLISILMLLQVTRVLTMDNGIYLSLGLLIASLIPIYLFKESDLANATPKIKFISKNKSIFYLTIIINCLYAIFCKGIGKSFLTLAIEKSNIDLFPINYIGGLFGCIIYYLIYRFNKNSNHITWNFTFSTFILSMFIYIIANTNFLFYTFGFLIGIGSTMGMINMYYILGVIGKKYWNHTYIRLSIILIGIVGGISGIVLGKLVSQANGIFAGSAVLIISVLIVMILLFISPLLSNSYFKDEWSEDSEKSEVDNEKIIQFKKYNLTNKEIELCKLLLDDYTLRQAATMLDIKETSVIGYQSKIYKKLNINTRKQLYELFK